MLGLQKLTTKIITFSEAPCGLRVLAQKTMPPCTWDLFLSNRGHSLSHYHHFYTFLSNFCFLFQHSCSFNFSSVSFFFHFSILFWFPFQRIAVIFFFIALFNFSFYNFEIHEDEMKKLVLWILWCLTHLAVEFLNFE